jgi:predicted metallo-beta-lactamase superfamily hydrolase
MLGYVTMVSISDGSERFLYTSDVEGPSLDEQAKFMIDSKPDVIICDGPMTYMLGYKYPASALEASERNLIDIVERCKLKTLVLDHHFLRDLNWRERMPDLLSRCEELGTEFMTAAELAG